MSQTLHFHNSVDGSRRSLILGYVKVQLHHGSISWDFHINSSAYISTVMIVRTLSRHDKIIVVLWMI